MKLTVDQEIRKAWALAQQGQEKEAEAIYQSILQRFPGNRRAYDGLEPLHKERTDIVPEKDMQTLLDHYNKGELKEVLDLVPALARRFPDASMIYDIAGAASASLGRFDIALASYERVLQLKPDDADAFINRGVVLRELRRPDEAITSFEVALRLKPHSADAHYNLGIALQGMNRLDEANAAYEKAIRLKPDHIEAHYNRAFALKELKRLDEAIASYDKALQLNPEHAEAHNNRANVLKGVQRLDESLASYDKAIRIKPGYAEAHNNRGVVLHELRRPEEAIAAFEKAIQLRPDYAEAYNNRGISLKQLKRLDESIASYNRAVQLKPAYADAWYNRGNALKELQRLDEAIASYDEALKLRPGYAPALGQTLYLKAKICDWTAAAPEIDLARLGLDGNAVHPFMLLAMDDDPLTQLQRAKTWSQDFFAPTQPFSFALARSPAKLRIGYFSADFHDHATMFLMAGLFELHDKTRFEIHAFSYGTDHKSAMRARLLDAVDCFHDISARNDLQIVELARGIEIDIAVDLKGYTTDSRSELFAHRLAPIQVSYLGYPGSMGVDFMDYIIADRVVLPQDAQDFYAEKVIYLPHSYQVNDQQRLISDRHFARRDMGLPDTGFIFCSFNNNYKISPAEFDVWMRLLRDVDGSVLWLLKDNVWVETNLRREAEARGIVSDRLVFAERVPLADHLARHAQADLFLDTFNVNAHTTASDALWAGLPVVTRLGKSFAARVAGSLLRAINMPELVTDTIEAYEKLALDLATDPHRLAAVREKLAANRLTAPLFDTEKYTRHIERAYELAFERRLAGLPPDHIHVD